MKIFGNIEILPIIHRKAEVSAYTREFINRNSFDLIAINLPYIVYNEVLEGVAELPEISIVTIDNDNDSYIIPIDPCDCYIEAIRQCEQRRIPLDFIGSSSPSPLTKNRLTPDELLIDKIGYENWLSTTLYATLLENNFFEIDNSILILRDTLNEISKSYKNPLLIIEISILPALISSVTNNKKAIEPENNFYKVNRFIAKIESLYFLLGELPFVTAQYEKNRMSIFEEKLDITDMYKRLFLETRDNYSDKGSEKLSITRVQQGLTFLRNLTFQENKISPSLFNMIIAAKGIGGDSFALKVMKAATYYPFFSIDIDENTVLSAGITSDSNLVIKTPFKDRTAAINLLNDSKSKWRTIKIKPDKELWDSRKESYRWTMEDLVSHLPDDIFIENFNKHAKKQTLSKIKEQNAKTEEFQTSFKDGLDFRETIRNWHKKKIYVKEFPKVNTGIDTVIVIFDEQNDIKYPLLTTWYAEHDNESTLSFYSTDPFQNIVGPGIGECKYGGFSLIFPPRIIEGVESYSQILPVYLSSSEKLTLHAINYSEEKCIAYISNNPPSDYVVKMAKKFGKYLFRTPLSTFSNETIRKLKKFHMLDGKGVRSWASRFIGD